MKKTKNQQILSKKLDEMNKQIDVVELIQSQENLIKLINLQWEVAEYTFAAYLDDFRNGKTCCVNCAIVQPFLRMNKTELKSFVIGQIITIIIGDIDEDSLTQQVIEDCTNHAIYQYYLREVAETKSILRGN